MIPSSADVGSARFHEEDFYMFGFGKKKIKLAAPVAGRIIDITEVADDVFSTKMMGDGFAVEPTDGADTIVAPCDGEVTLVAKTLHAVALQAEGLEILLHVGLDTVELEGQGFRALVQAGDKVQCGTPLLHFDRAAIEAQGKKLTTMLVLTNGAEKVKRLEKHLQEPEAVLTVEMK